MESCIDASRQSRAATVTQRLAGRLQPSSTHMATYVPSRPQGRFLRYQFDSAAQLRRHCNLVEGRVLLFFPEPRPVLGERTRALIELCLANSDQQVALPAMVHSRSFDAAPGTWLELRALSVVAGLQSAVVSPKRQQRRLALDQLAWVDHGDDPVMARRLRVEKRGSHATVVWNPGRDRARHAGYRRGRLARLRLRRSYNGAVVEKEALPFWHCNARYLRGRVPAVGSVKPARRMF